MPPGSEYTKIDFLLSANAIVSAMFCHAGPSSLVSFFLSDSDHDLQIQILKNGLQLWRTAL